MGISLNTADNHRHRAMKKLGAKNTAMLIRCALRQHLTTLDDHLTQNELSILASESPIKVGPDKEHASTALP
jgi:hypothetical protein